MPVGYRSYEFLPTELFSIWLLLIFGIFALYYSGASASYYYFFVWNKQKYYPLTLPEDITEQIKVETGIANRTMPMMAVLFMPFTWGTLHGYSRMYYTVEDYGWAYMIAVIPLYLFFCDFMIYWNHRILHQGVIYKYIHKPHHTFRFTTPYSSHAFHSLDAFGQGIPYYIFAYIFPVHNILFTVLFVIVNFWTISIHDQVDFFADSVVLNSADHHTIHHADFNFNYGQYFTLWDRLGGTFRQAFVTHEWSTGKRINQKKVAARAPKSVIRAIPVMAN
jgi:lathosterol oxidase